MKHSTFWTNKKGKACVYTTIAHTDYHKFLRDDHGGRTYLHNDTAKLNFIIGMPLDKPVPYIKRITGDEDETV